MLLKTVFVYGKIKKILYRGGTMYNFYAEFTKDGVSSGVNTAENNDFMFSLTEENGRIKGTITAHADLTFRSLSLTAEREFGFNDLFCKRISGVDNIKRILQKRQTARHNAL